MSVLLGLGLGMKLLGLGGTGVLGIGARLLGYDRKAVAIAKRIPPKAWIAIGIALALVVGFFVHQHKAHVAIAAAEKRGEDRAFAHVEKQARSIEAKARELTGQINSAIRDRHNEELGHIRGAADALRVRGPGKALCGSSGLPAAAGGRQSAGGSGDAAMARLPYPEWQQLIGVPFADATRFAEQHDAYRDEVKTWRFEWYPKMTAAWEKLRSSSSRPR